MSAATTTAPAKPEPKKTKAPPTPPTPEQRAANKAVKDSVLAKDRFTRVFDEHGKAVPPNEPLPPQAQVIVNAIEAAGKRGVPRSDLVASLKGVLVTKQPEGRILSYYQKLIQDCGAVKVTINQPDVPAKKA